MINLSVLIIAVNKDFVFKMNNRVFKMMIGIC